MSTLGVSDSLGNLRTWCWHCISCGNVHAKVLRLQDSLAEPEVGTLEIPTAGSRDHRLGTNCKSLREFSLRRNIICGGGGRRGRGRRRASRGICKPCAFVHRKEGCKSGATCKFCHLCDQGARKQRKRDKHQMLRAMRQLPQARVFGMNTSLSCRGWR